MVTGEKKKIPVKEGLWTTPSFQGEEPQLVGSNCLSCGEIFFPKKDKGICSHCQSTNLQEVRLSRVGKIRNFSVVMRKPPVAYLGDVPYAYGCVDLPEGVRVETLFTGDLEALKVGMDAESVIEKLGDDEEGNEVMAYKFRPITAHK